MTEVVEAGGCAPPIIASDPREPDHLCWTVDRTAYVRSADRNATFHAVHFQRAPRQTETGLSMSMRFPVLIIPEFVDDAAATARKVAEILNKHWPTGEDE